MKSRLILIISLAAATGAYAQGPGRGPGWGPGGPRLLGGEPGRPGHVVTNAPYSADVITETMQTLPDGNQIHQTNTSKFYRDSQGRTRREQSLTGLRSLAPNAGPQEMVFINDPIAKTNYALNPTNKTATKSVMPARVGRGPGGPPPADAPAGGPVPRERVRGAINSADMSNVKTESLGKQTIEGVVAEGTRHTITIPAGQMGNALPIQIVSERWYSPDLQVVVLSKHSDPRSGEVTTRLANINRSEPSATLFEVPPEYKVTAAGRGRGAAQQQ